MRRNEVLKLLALCGRSWDNGDVSIGTDLGRASHTALLAIITDLRDAYAEQKTDMTQKAATIQRDCPGAS